MATDRAGQSSQQYWFATHDSGNDDQYADDLESEGLIDEPLLLTLAEWQ
jgi:hypothetical protein